MDRLGGERGAAGGRDHPEERIRQVGVRMGELIKQLISAVLILAVFVGLAFLVWQGQLADDALILYTGVILGYLLQSVQDLL